MYGGFKMSNNVKLLRIAEVKNKTGMSRASIYAEMKKGKFPKNIKITVRCVAWKSDDVDAWIEKKIQEAA